MTAGEIIWQDPPPQATGGRGRYGRMQRFVAALKERPGVWALYKEGGYSSSSSALRKMGCESTVRVVPGTNRYDIYARWPVTP